MKQSVVWLALMALLLVGTVVAQEDSDGEQEQGGEGGEGGEGSELDAGAEGAEGGEGSEGEEKEKEVQKGPGDNDFRCLLCKTFLGNFYGAAVGEEYAACAKAYGKSPQEKRACQAFWWRHKAEIKAAVAAKTAAFDACLKITQSKGRPYCKPEPVKPKEEEESKGEEGSADEGSA